MTQTTGEPLLGFFRQPYPAARSVRAWRSAGAAGPLVEPRTGSRRGVRVRDGGLAFLALAAAPVAAARSETVA